MKQGGSVQSAGRSPSTRSGQFFIIATVLIAGMLFLISNILLTAGSIDYGTVLRSHDIDTVDNLAEQTDQAWWNTNFFHRKALILEESTGSFLTNESVTIALDAPRNHINETCADIRVLQDGSRMPWTNTTPCTIDTYTTDFAAVDNDAVLRLQMDEGSGQWANDSSGFGNNGQLGGSTAVQSSDPGWASGKYRGGLRFDAGESDYVDIPESSDFPDGSDEYALTAWFRADTDCSCGIIGWGNWGTSNEVNALRLASIGASDDISLRHYWWGNDLDADTTVSYGGWHHVVAQFNGTHRQIWLDGELVAEDQPSGHNAVVADANVGVTNSNEYFDGSLDDVRVYTDALSADQVRGIAQNGVGLNVSVTLPPNGRTDDMYVYYNSLGAGKDTLTGIQHTTENSPNVTFIGPERRREEVLRQMDEHVAELNQELSFDIGFTIDDERCGTVSLQTPISRFAREVC